MPANRESGENRCRRFIALCLNSKKPLHSIQNPYFTYMNLISPLLRFLLVSLAGAVVATLFTVWIHSPTLDSALKQEAFGWMALSLLPGYFALSPIFGCWALYFLGKPPARVGILLSIGLLGLFLLILVVNLLWIHKVNGQGLRTLYKAKEEAFVALPPIQPGHFIQVSPTLNLRVEQAAGKEGWYRGAIIEGEQTVLSADSLYFSPPGPLAQIRAEARSGTQRRKGSRNRVETLEFARLKFWLRAPGEWRGFRELEEEWFGRHQEALSLSDLWVEGARLQGQIDSLSAPAPADNRVRYGNLTHDQYAKIARQMEGILIRYQVEAARRLALPFWVPGVGLMALVLMSGLKNLLEKTSRFPAGLISLSLAGLGLCLLDVVFEPMEAGGYGRNSVLIVCLVPVLLGLTGLGVWALAGPRRQPPGTGA